MHDAEAQRIKSRERPRPGRQVVKAMLLSTALSARILSRMRCRKTERKSARRILLETGDHPAERQAGRLFDAELVARVPVIPMRRNARLIHRLTAGSCWR